MLFRSSQEVKIPQVDFPGGPVVKNLPINAEDMGPYLVRENFICLGANDISVDYIITEKGIINING